MGNFQGGGNRGGGFRGGNGGGGRPSFGGNRGGGDRGPVTMHKAVCDECQKNCEVPFRPSQDKPIYCNDCFSSKREDGDRAPRREFNDRGPKRDFNDRPAPSFSKPASAPAGNDMSKQLSEMNSKLDRLVSAIEKMSGPKVSTPVVVSAKPMVKQAPVVAKKVNLPAQTGVKKVVAKVVAKKVIAKAPIKKVVAKKGKK